MAARLEEQGEGAFALRGALDFASVAALWKQVQERFPERLPARIDLAGVARSDSSGVALLLAWQRLARQRRQRLHFVNMPPQMQAIVRVAALQTVFSEENPNPCKQPTSNV